MNDVDLSATFWSNQLQAVTYLRISERISYELRMLNSSPVWVHGAGKTVDMSSH